MALYFECRINKNTFLQIVSFGDFAHGEPGKPSTRYASRVQSYYSNRLQLHIVFFFFQDFPKSLKKFMQGKQATVHFFFYF